MPPQNQLANLTGLLNKAQQAQLDKMERPAAVSSSDRQAKHGSRSPSPSQGLQCGDHEGLQCGDHEVVDFGEREDLGETEGRREKLRSGLMLVNLAKDAMFELDAMCDSDIDLTASVHSLCSSRRWLSTSTKVLFDDAMRMRVGTVDARNPLRAHAGGAVLRSARDVLTKGGLSINSGSSNVSRLFLDSMPEALVKIESIQQLMHPDLLRRFLQKVASGHNSVEATFHGASAEHIDHIMQEGLNPACGIIGAYGQGAYVGTHAGVAHQYATPDSTGLHHMCLILVVVGSTVVKGKPGETPAATAMDSKINPTQYCFIEEDRLLASHVITYRVNGASQKRIGGGWDDPFARKLSAAVLRSGRLVKKSGKR